MVKITKLTAEQQVALSEFRERYFRYGVSAEPADRKRAEAAFARAYRTIGREPVPVIWVDSPLTASLLIDLLKRDSLRNSLGEGLRDSLRNSLRNSLGDSLRVSLRNSLWNSLQASLQANLWNSLQASLQANLQASLGEGLRNSLQNSKIEPAYTYWWGQQDLYWVAFYRFCAEIGARFDTDAADRLDIMHEIGLSCMWWYPRDGLIIACERPLAFCFDASERLHNDAGPAIEFHDGWKIYAVHGVHMPPWVFEQPERLTIEAIDAETNTEIQRVMIEQFGWDRYAAECGARVIDYDERWGTLMARSHADGSSTLFLSVINGSPEPDGSFRKYILPVSDQCEPIPDPDDPNGQFGEPQELTALNAVASTYGMRGEEYAALKCRT